MKNCSKYKELISDIYFNRSEKIILDSSLNWSSFELKNLSREVLAIHLENFKGFDIESTSLKNFVNMKIFNLAKFTLIDKDIYIFESLFDFYRNGVDVGKRCEITDFLNLTTHPLSGFNTCSIFDSTIYSENLCPLVFNNLKIEVVDFEGLENSFLKKKYFKICECFAKVKKSLF